MYTTPSALLDLAEDLASGAQTGSELKLKEALEDYHKVCALLENERLSVEDRSQWKEIRLELETEISRLATRLQKNHQ